MQILFLPDTGACTIRDDEVIIPLPIVVVVVENAFSFLLISTCSTALLYIAFETLWHGVVDDEADIVFVYSHTEGNCCDDDLDFVFHPHPLDLLPA